LKELSKGYDDTGPVLDCVVYFDGENWNSIIGFYEDDFEKLKVMKDYKINYDVSDFGKKDLMNYTVNIYENGNILSIVTTCGSHGTHVAGIVGGYYEDTPGKIKKNKIELNGVAPGCQMISIKIGDHRLGSMETGPGLIRAFQCILQNKCDILNLSYGEGNQKI
jgi:tripeptidyl-peptidase II